ncbi:hypothetical protein BGZ88_001728 [Linnemannia elongata]|nr:hypothetical protein BGZ88_001728 [Linnemannia elongata]
MGVLKKLYCITSDPAGRAAYGLTFDVAYDATSPYAYEMILYKTNDYPASPITANLTWSVVSRIYHGAVIKDESGSDVLLRKFSCTVDALGVFTLFSRHWTSSKYDQNPKLPHVIRYDPNGTMENKGGYTGVGAWSMITVPTEHGWSSYFERAVSGYVSAPGGGSVLVVAYVTRDGETVGVASVDEQAKTLSPMSNWSMNRTTHGYPNQIAIGNNRLYTYAYRNIIHTYQAFLTSFPLTPGTLSPQPQDKIYDTSTVFYDRPIDSETNIMYAKDGNLTLIHVRSVSKDSSIQFLPSAIYTFIDSPTTVTVGKPQNFTARFPSPIGSFAPLGNGTISPPNTSQRLFFALVTSYDDMYAFGDDGTGWKTVKALQQVNVTDSVGINPNPTAPQNGGGGSGSGGESTGAIVGVVVGIIVLGGILYLFISRNGKNKTKANEAIGPFTKSNLEPRHNGGPNYYNPGFTPGQHHQLQQHATPTSHLPMAPITPLSQEQHHQTYQDHMHALQFSSHPRPNVVTTAYSTDPATSNPPIPYPGWSGAPQAAWQPTPFVPPAQPATSTEASSLSASPIATEYGQSSQDLHVSSTPMSSSPPSIPRSTKPSPEIGSPHN